MASDKVVYVKKTNNPKMGRPPKKIDWKQVELLCKILCTESEIASVCEVHIDTLYTRCVAENGQTFPEFYKQFSDQGKMSMRRAQYKKALEGHPTMLIWLGKQMLGQRDQVEFSNAQPIQLGYDPSKLGDDDK